MTIKTIAPVSVVIPCYRCASTIQRAIQSVIAQILKPAEVILVDDASGDETLAVLKEFEQQHPDWIKVIALAENQGVASARNAGWAAASHTFIAFLDADDSWHPDKICIQFEYMQNNSDIALCGHQCVWLRDNQGLPELSKDRQASVISASSLLFKNAFSTPTIMLRRNIPFRFQEGKRYAEDLLLWQQIAFAGIKVIRIENTLAYLYKPLYGTGGLSAQMWEMESGELNNFIVLYRAGTINFPFYLAASLFSIAKFIKRLLAVRLKILASAIKIKILNTP
jgi:glycosyltransferase involved in cell wall biosynthesis